MSIHYRANLKRWSELVAKKKQENQQQNENDTTTEEAKEEKQEADEKKMDAETKSNDNNEGENEVPPANGDVKKTLVEKVKSAALTDVAFSSDEE